MQKFVGTGVALVTPFKKDLSKYNIALQIVKGDELDTFSKILNEIPDCSAFFFKLSSIANCALTSLIFTICPISSIIISSEYPG